MKVCRLCLIGLVGFLISPPEIHAADILPAPGKAKGDRLKGDLTALGQHRTQTPLGSYESKFTDAEYSAGVVTITEVTTTPQGSSEARRAETKIIIPLRDVEVTTEVASQPDRASSILIQSAKPVIEIKTRVTPGNIDMAPRTESSYKISVRQPRQATEIGADFRRLIAEAKRDKSAPTQDAAKQGVTNFDGV